MKFFGSTKNGENVSNLEKLGLVLVQCHLVDNQCQQKSELLNTFRTNKSYAYLLNVEPRNLVFLKTYDIEFDEIIITFQDKNDRLLKIEGKVDLKLLFNK